MDKITIKRLSPEGEQCFFGYYDIPAFDAKTGLHLCHRAPFRDRLPDICDEAELGFLKDGEFMPFAKTSLWNFQQGSMLCYGGGEYIFYNDMRDEKPRLIRRENTSGKETVFERPAANVSADGRYSVSVNFARIYGFRPGYGYVALSDAGENVNFPVDDGVFVTDLASGETKLVLDYCEIRRLFEKAGCPMPDRKVLINHITLSQNAKRILMLTRYFPDVSRNGGWTTAMLTCDIDGGNPRILLNYSYASHYHWRDDRTLLVHSFGPLGNQLYEYDDFTGECEAIDVEFFPKDGHCSYSPDRKWILYDSYPDANKQQWLFLYNIEKKKGMALAAVDAMPVDVVDIRCDLHPRWMPDGETITFDSTHEGFRGVYSAYLGDVMKEF